MATREDLVKEIAAILNKASRESCSDTPDFILAEHMVRSLEVLEDSIRSRETWFGRPVNPTTLRRGEDGRISGNKDNH
jgi:hypothetical protein